MAFFGTFIILVGILPSVFIYAGGREYTDYDYPDYFTKDDIANIKYFQQMNITRALTTHHMDFNPDIDFKFDIVWSVPWGYVITNHRDWEFLIWYGGHNMEYEELGEYVYKADIVSAWDENTNSSRFYPVDCVDITITVWFTDHNSTRNDIELSYDEGIMTYAIGFGFEGVTATFGAWDIVGRLLLFQDLEVFYGTEANEALALHSMIMLPLWLMIAYIIYRLILLAIPFVG